MKVRRRPFHDEYAENGESAVLIDNRILVLAPLATVLLSTLDDQSWVDLSQIAAELTRTFGRPPSGADALEATTHAVRALAAEGLVETTG